MTQWPPPRPDATGTGPAGQPVQIRTTGIAVLETANLVAGQTIASAWVSTQNYVGVLYVVRSDQPSSTGGLMVEYSDDGQNVVPAGLAVTYGASQAGQLIQRALAPKGRFIRIRYRNGETAQTNFRLEVRLSTTLIQPTMGSLNLPMSDTTLGVYAVADVQLSDGAAYQRIGRVADAAKVHVVNPAAGASTAANQATEIARLDAILARQSDGTARVSASCRAGQVQLADGSFADVLSTAPANGVLSATIVVLGIATANRQLVAGVAGKRIRVLGYTATSENISCGWAFYSGSATGAQLNVRRVMPVTRPSTSA